MSSPLTQPETDTCFKLIGYGTPPSNQGQAQTQHNTHIVVASNLASSSSQSTSPRRVVPLKSSILRNPKLHPALKAIARNWIFAGDLSPSDS